MLLLFFASLRDLRALRVNQRARDRQRGPGRRAPVEAAILLALFGMAKFHRSLVASIALATLAAAPLAAQQLRPAVDAWRKAHEREILDEAFALMAIPNVA